jgi:hypothetical protein
MTPSVTRASLVHSTPPLCVRHLTRRMLRNDAATRTLPGAPPGLQQTAAETRLRRLLVQQRLPWWNPDAPAASPPPAPRSLPASDADTTQASTTDPPTPPTHQTHTGAVRCARSDVPPRSGGPPRSPAPRQHLQHRLIRLLRSTQLHQHHRNLLRLQRSMEPARCHPRTGTNRRPATGIASTKGNPPTGATMTSINRRSTASIAALSAPSAGRYSRLPDP